jgi:hypothetical protein
LRQQEDAMSNHQIIVASLTRHLRETKSLREAAGIRKLRDGYQVLLENEYWLSGDVNPLASLTIGARS